MKLSTRGRYGTRLMVDLAQHYAEGPVALKAIAERQELSVKYLEQLIIPLKTAGLIRSVRGRQGGYMLAGKPAIISVGRILEALEGELALVDCVADSEVCDRWADCPTRNIWVKMTDLLETNLFSLSLQDILDRTTP
jgi:Rrf2 family cysteine metabolism transcriptional repressor